MTGLFIMKKNVCIFFILIFSCSTFFLTGQSAINHPLGEITSGGSETISYKGSRNYKFTERSDLRVYQNGKYVGLQSKIVSAFIIPGWTDKGLVYEGNFFVDQDTNRNKTQVALGIHEAIPSSFLINDDGNLTMLVDNGYPSFRSFPAYSAHKLKKGDVWEAKAIRAVDPLSKGIITKMPIYVQYTYTGDDIYNGEPVYLISAQWATRYNMGGTTMYVDWGGDKELSYAQGSHKATIIVSKQTGAAFVIRDNVDETFVYTDGNKYQFKGTISLFTEYPPAIDRSKLIAALKRMELLDDDEAEKLLQRPIYEQLKKKLEENQTIKTAPITVDNTEAGIRLTIQNLQFKADSAQLLPGEEKRLDQIVEILKLADSAQFMIEGHTADTGYEAGELMLSKERAYSIADALSKRGIRKERFICKGSGSKKPIASNDTAEGKALNRRVEITILD